MSDSVSDSEIGRASQYNGPPPEKQITFDFQAQKNNAGPSKSSMPYEMHIPCVTQSSSDSNQKIADGREGRRERQARYRENHREIIRERNRNYYSQRLKNAQPTASGLGLNDIEAVPDDDVVNNKEDNRKKIRNERSRRYREKNRETIKQRNKDYRQRQKNVQQQLEVPNTNMNEVLESHTYSNFIRDKLAHKSFTENFKNNHFGHACSVCDRLWFEKDLKKASSSHENLIHKITLEEDLDNYLEWRMTNCRKRLKEGVYPRFFACQIEPPKPIFVPCDGPATSLIKNEESDDPLAMGEQSLQCENQSFAFVGCSEDSINVKSESINLKEEVTDGFEEDSTT